MRNRNVDPSCDFFGLVSATVRRCDRLHVDVVDSRLRAVVDEARVEVAIDAVLGDAAEVDVDGVERGDHAIRADVESHVEPIDHPAFVARVRGHAEEGCDDEGRRGGEAQARGHGEDLSRIISVFALVRRSAGCRICNGSTNCASFSLGSPACRLHLP